MKILMLAPEPFLVDRGTPIAVDLILRSLSQRRDQVDLLTYHLGADVDYDGVQVHRTHRIPGLRDVRPGFSFAKVICDLSMLLKIIPLVQRNSYQIIHAVEESVFIALVLKWLFKIPYIYDMDSSLSQQMINRYPYILTPLAFLLNFLEGLAIRNAKAVVPVCDALYLDIKKYQPGRVVILRDVSLLSAQKRRPIQDLRSALGIQGPVIMYVGNLEDYQGIDLLLEGFALAVKNGGCCNLVIIGGNATSIHHYHTMAERLGIHENTHFLGPKPVDLLAHYLDQADILISPRLKGSNTPMKVFSYLDSGKPLLATNLPAHTQVLDEKVAVLVDPSPQHLAEGLIKLIKDDRLRRKLGRAGRKLIADKFTYAMFQEGLNNLYDWIQSEIGDRRIPASRAAQTDQFSPKTPHP